MPIDKSLLDDLIKVAENALGTLVGGRHEMAAQGRAVQERVLQKLELVSRKEFDATFAMLVAIRTAQEDLAERLHEIEANLTLSSPKTAKKKKSASLRSVNQVNRKSVAGKRSKRS